MKHKTGFMFVCMAICLFAIAGVCAVDANETSSDIGNSIETDSQNYENAGIGNVADGDFNELAGCIENASEDSVLSLDKDYKYYSGNAEGICLNKSLTIDGRGHVLDGANLSRILMISDANVTLKNLMFKNGFADEYGGAIHLKSATVLISNCTFINNRANVGGGALSSLLSNVSIDESSFSYNGCEGLYVSGGAIHLYNSRADMSHSTFMNNTADVGGAVFTMGSSLDINGSEFSYNTAFYGGGIFAEFSLKINSTVFHDNRAKFRGGAIHSSYLTDDNGIMEVNNSMFYNNHAQYGGAVSSSNVGRNVIQNSEVFSNTATYGAVIARFSKNSIEIIDCYCHDNEAVNGTVVYAPSNGKVTLKNSNFTKNSGEYGSLIYSIQGRIVMQVSNYDITVSGCNAIDNPVGDSLIYNFYANLIVDNSSFVYEHGQYPVFVIKKLATGNVSYENNFWGVENPDFSKLIYINGTAPNQDSGLSSADYDDDCSSNVIQIDENHTVSSFRRDSSSSITLFIGGDGEMRQDKQDSTYFIHMAITRDGWVMGNGGHDAPYLSEMIEGIARKMIENDEISQAYLEMILSMKAFEGNWGHFIIKSPDGRYGIVNYYDKIPTIEIGVLKSGEYILCPNDYAKCKKGNISDLPVSGYVEASRYLAGIDLYGSSRTTVQTYEYIREVSGSHLISHVDCYVSNDDGHLINLSSEMYFNDIFSNGIYIHGEEIPLIMDGMYLTRLVLADSQLPLIETKIASPNLQIVYNKGKYLTATLHDAGGNPVADANLKIELNGKVHNLITDSRGQAKLFVNLAPKTYRASISFAGKGMYAKSSKEVKITVKKAAPKLVAKSKKFKKSKKVKRYTVTLKNNVGKAMKNVKVTLKIRGKKAISAKTNSKGKATFKIRNLNKKGTFKATIKFKGNKYYTKAAKKANIKIR